MPTTDLACMRCSNNCLPPTCWNNSRVDGNIDSGRATGFFFTAFRRINKAGEVSTVFLISNYKASARQHVRAYEIRWVIEKFFRTAKQYLGFQDCQSSKLNLQKNHIMNVFLIYALLQVERKKTKQKNVERVIKSQYLHDFNHIRLRFIRSAENFGIA